MQKRKKKKHEIKYTNHHHRLSVDFCPHVVLYSKSMSLHLDLELAANIALVMTPKAYPEEAQLFRMQVFQSTLDPNDIM